MSSERTAQHWTSQRGGTHGIRTSRVLSTRVSVALNSHQHRLLGGADVSRVETLVVLHECETFHHRDVAACPDTRGIPRVRDVPPIVLKRQNSSERLCRFGVGVSNALVLC